MVHTWGGAWGVKVDGLHSWVWDHGWGPGGWGPKPLKHIYKVNE